MFFLICFCLLLPALAFDHSLLLVPLVVLKILLLGVLLVVSLALAFVVTFDLDRLVNVMLKDTPLDAIDERASIGMAAMIVAALSAAGAMMQLWLLLVLLSAYQKLSEAEIYVEAELMVKRERTREAYKRKRRLDDIEAKEYI